MYNRETSSTVCAKCANLIVPPGARQHWYYWCCNARQWEPVYNPVTGQHDRHPPHRYCKDINSGDCPAYEPGPNNLNPKATADGEIIP